MRLEKYLKDAGFNISPRRRSLIEKLLNARNAFGEEIEWEEIDRGDAIIYRATREDALDLISSILHKENGVIATRTSIVRWDCYTISDAYVEIIMKE